MFCSYCGISCLTNAKYCHGCGGEINGNRERPGDNSGNTDRDSSKHATDASTTTTSTACSGSGSGTPSQTPPATFAQFRARKDDRSKHFKKKDEKRMKLDNKAGKSTEVKINIGVMTKKEDSLSVKRGVTLPLTVPTSITYDDLLNKAVDKHHRFNKDIIKSGNPMFYYLLFGDKNKANNLPRCDEPFTLKRYKEEIDKPYTRITLYLCPCSHYLDSIWDDFDSDSDTDRPICDAPQRQNTLSMCGVKPVAVLNQESENKDMKQPCLLIDDEPKPREPESSRIESQCPICFQQFPIQHIEEHADNCSLWLMECEQPSDLESVFVVEELGEPDVSQHKRLLKEQIEKCASGLSSDPKRVTVRRKFMWEDFKAARKSKIQPLSNLKVVFVGEPSIDDGGPKRELFSELLTIIQHKFFSNGYPVLSAMALNGGDFKICGEVMGMSIVQGGPAPNFLAPPVVSFLVGKPLLTEGNKNQSYKSAGESLTRASSDEQVKALLTSDSILDVLGEIGYTGIPQKETLFTVKPIVQSICLKDQLSEFLPALLQIAHGIEGCGLLEVMRRSPHIWQPVYGVGHSFQITAEEFLEQLDVEYSPSQIKNSEMDTYKFFCDAIENIDASNTKLQLRDFIKWLTGSYDIPPLSIPKRFSVKFVHGCPAGCACRPTASTCDITIKLPVHINSENTMNEMIASAVEESYGFGLV